MNLVILIQQLISQSKEVFSNFGCLIQENDLLRKVKIRRKETFEGIVEATGKLDDEVEIFETIV
jgi:hypothetical protein